MRVLAYVTAALYYLKCLGIVSNHNISDGDLLNFVNSEQSYNEEQIHQKTTEVSFNEMLNHSLSESDADDFVESQPLISNPLFEDMLRNNSVPGDQIRKRHIPGSGLSHEMRMQLLSLHNLYRSNVTPPAGDMAYMEWDDELARLAQIWSDKCDFRHEMPENDYPDMIGQNLYKGTDPTGYLALYMWYEEYRLFDLRNGSCRAPPNETCGHYNQMACAESNKLGCGMTKCGVVYHLTCHYSPQYLRGRQMYKVAKPCSQCPEKKKTLCLNNLCMTSEQCKNNPFDCQFAKCDLECHNCGRLDKKNCLCKCADGWDTRDCSAVCYNRHAGCEKAWPNKYSCSLHNHMVRKKFCRKMCEMCNGVDTAVSNNTCCDGKLCEDGYVLDPYTNHCKCVLLCPGPLCDTFNTTLSKKPSCDGTLCDDGFILDPNSCKCVPRCPGPLCDSLNTSMSSNTPCDGKICDYGFILDPHADSCNCTLLCPGPLCDNEDAGRYQAVLENSANYYNKNPYFAHWIIIFTLYFRICFLRKYF